MRATKEIIDHKLNSGESSVHIQVITTVLILIALLTSSLNAYAQNANERDIQLPTQSDESLPSIYLIGDSTVRNGAGDGGNGQWGWGSFLYTWFNPDKVNVVNRAIGGRSSRTYMTQGYWKQMLEIMKPGDIVLIQFGHNDASPVDDARRARGVIDGIGDESIHLFNQLTKEEETVFTYGEYLRRYISDIRKAGATPIICSPVPTNGTVISKLVKYDQWAEQVALTEGVAFVDLNDIIGKEYEQMSNDEVNALFVQDRVHSTLEGAKFSAKMVVSALKGLSQNPVEPFLAEEAKEIKPRTANKDYSLPIITGYGQGVFQIGDLIYSNDFENEDDWFFQIEETESQYDPRIDFRNGFLEVLMPGRGTTIWNKNKFSGNIAITYKVKAPSTYTDDLGVVVRDINSFWHASHPGDPKEIFNEEIYTGAFPSYHTLQGYYSSIGGRDNTTTRFRRYPRVEDGHPVSHIVLSDKDAKEGYLIQADRTQTIQLVVFDDIIQFIVDGKVFYEVRKGDQLQVENEDGTMSEMEYAASTYKPYNEGWFGFRLVNTHHIFSDFRVYRLEASK